MADAYLRAVNRLAKWRSVFAGRWLGTRPRTDPETIAVRDVIEKLLMLRVEINALTALCVERGIFTTEAFKDQIIHECDYLQASFEVEFPGFKATDYGMQIDAPLAADTMKDWPR